MKIINTILLFILITIFTDAYAQDTLTLAECMKLAVNHSYDMEGNKLKKEEYGIKKKLNKQELYPKMNFNVSHNYYIGNTVDPTTYDFINRNAQTNTIQISGSYSLINFLKGKNTDKYLSLIMGTEDLDSKINELDIQYQTSDLYYNIIKEEQVHVFLENNLSQLDSLIRRFKYLLKEKLIDRKTVLELELERNVEYVRLVESTQRIEKGYIYLKSLIGEMDRDIKIKHVDAKPLISMLDEHSYEIKSFDDFLEIKKYQKEEEIILTQDKDRKLNRFPDVFLSTAIRTNYNSLGERVVGQEFVATNGTIGYVEGTGEVVKELWPELVTTRGKNPLMNQLNENKNVYIGMGMTWQFSNLYGMRHEKKIVNNQLQQIKNEKEQIEARKKTEFQRIKMDIEKHETIYETQNNNINLLETILGLEEEQLKEQIIDANDYIRTRRKYVRIKIASLNAFFNIISDKNDLLFKSESFHQISNRY